MYVTTENNFSLHCIFAVRGANPSLGLVNTIWFTSSAAGVAPVDMMKEFYFYDVSEISQLWQTHLELYGQFNHCFAPQLSHLNQWTGSFTLNTIDLIRLTCNLPPLLHDLVWMVLKFIQTGTARADLMHDCKRKCFLRKASRKVFSHGFPVKYWAKCW